MPLTVEEDEAPNPLHVRFLGAESHMSHAQCGSYPVQQFRLAGGLPYITCLTDHSLVSISRSHVVLPKTTQVRIGYICKHMFTIPE